MFGFFESQETTMRGNAANWLELAEKVYHYRRDILTATQLADLQARRATLESLLKERAGAEKLKLAIEALEEVLGRVGGKVYSKSSLVENVEFFLVAALVILGIRTYFVQPFKIPTNSMWPTYNGMTPEVYRSREEEPGAASVAVRAVVRGAWPHRIDAPAEGEVLIPVFGERRGLVHCKIVSGFTWLVIPTKVRQYSVIVGNSTVSTKVPLDFDFDWAIYDAFFASDPKDAYTTQKLYDKIQQHVETGQFEDRNVDGEVVHCIRTGRHVKAGQRLLSFDELTGDQLFVDRVSTHFFPPKVGQGFVFRTDMIKSPYMTDYETHQQIESYYIKRLVGVPGDTLEIKEPVLYRNGQPITGAPAFDANAHRQGQYAGYGALMSLAPGQKVKVPDRGYFAMGDNSFNSQDSRYWGFVPAEAVVGRPILVYFPFTKHWGPAK